MGKSRADPRDLAGSAAVPCGSPPGAMALGVAAGGVPPRSLLKWRVARRHSRAPAEGKLQADPRDLAGSAAVLGGSPPGAVAPGVAAGGSPP
eukprot:10080077-Alexandrium_andersonii.AAC.1